MNKAEVVAMLRRVLLVPLGWDLELRSADGIAKELDRIEREQEQPAPVPDAERELDQAMEALRLFLDNNDSYDAWLDGYRLLREAVAAYDRANSKREATDAT